MLQGSWRSATAGLRWDFRRRHNSRLVPLAPLEVRLRRLACLAPLLVVLAASPAAAAGAGIRWNSCLGESNRNFACDRSTGSEALVGTFQAPASMSMMAADAFVRITVAESDMPGWWTMWGNGSCRPGAATFSADVSAETDCDDPWQGNATGGFGLRSLDDRGLLLAITMAVPRTAPVSISGGQTYAFFRITIQHTRSMGAGACAGCNTPACITLESALLYPHREEMNPGSPDPRLVELTEGIAGVGGAGNIVTWQGGTPTCTAGARKSSSWSDLKRRFR